MTKIYPRCKTENHTPYVNVHGYYFPCCWAAHIQAFEELKNFLGEHIEDFNITKHDIDYIENSTGMKMLEESWNTDAPFVGCAKSLCTTPFDINETSKYSQQKRKAY